MQYDLVGFFETFSNDALQIGKHQIIVCVTFTSAPEFAVLS